MTHIRTTEPGRYANLEQVAHFKMEPDKSIAKLHMSDGSILQVLDFEEFQTYLLFNALKFNEWRRDDWKRKEDLSEKSKGQ